MNSDTETDASAPQAERGAEAQQAAGAMRLSPRECLLVGGIVIPLLLVLPSLWERVEPLEPDGPYRMPNALREDYWLFDRYSRQAAGRSKTLVLGDSAIWGQFVTPDQTLPQCLNELAGENRFANLGLVGMHPTALAGLVEHFGRGIRDGRVILHCNLVWMAHKQDEPQGEQQRRFYHSRLLPLPQFAPHSPDYREKFSERLGILVERVAPFRSWARHMQLAYFNRNDLPTWTIEHPYGNPAAAVLAGLPEPRKRARHKGLSWQARGVARENLSWDELSTSLHWRLFRRTVDILERRGNRVFVLVGPFNEHMLTDASRHTYHDRKDEVEAWLRDKGIAYYAPDALPGELYPDASHLLSQGYAQLAGQLWREPPFAAFDGRR